MCEYRSVVVCFSLLSALACLVGLAADHYRLRRLARVMIDVYWCTLAVALIATYCLMWG